MVNLGHENRVVGQLGQLLAMGTVRDLSDGQLLERFATAGGTQSEMAITAIIERHGPMVMRVCQSILTDPHDAEDAFQATFLVLVRRGRGLWVENSLGPWLHQVAMRTAAGAQRAAARRRRHERAAMAARAATMTTAQASDSDLERLLHEELNRLPERFRVPLVLCDLEGLTQEHAARHLGWPIGTVKSRLSRARDRLRQRLFRRGLMAGAGLAVVPPSSGLGDLVPPALVQQTTLAAVRFSVSRTILDGSVAAITYGVLTAMNMTRWWKMASVLIVAGATVSGAGLVSGRGTQAVEPRPAPSAVTQTGNDDQIAVITAKEGKFEFGFSERGQLESVHQDSLLCHVEGRTTIISLVPEGTKVKKGDLVMELDSALLRDQLTNQRIATQGVEAAHEAASRAREITEIAIKEYEEGISLYEQAAIQGEIKLAESKFMKADARVQRTQRAREQLNALIARGGAGKSPADILADLDVSNQVDAAENDLHRDKFALEMAHSKFLVLMKYTKSKRMAELKVELAKAQSDEQAKKQQLALEREKISRLEKQIVNCKLFAPREGVVVYANESRVSPQGSTIEEGATVRERQVLARILDFGGPMQVDVKVPESAIKLVRPGQNVRVWIDALRGESFSGQVTVVAPLPNPTTSSSSTRVFTTKIQLAQESPQLRPGMSANAYILVDERDHVLSIPSSCVRREPNGKTHIAVKLQGGGFEWREAVLGRTTGDVVEVKQGLKPGEDVALDIHKLIRRGLQPPPAPAKAP